MKRALLLLCLVPSLLAASCSSVDPVSEASRIELERIADLKLKNPSVPEPGLLACGQLNREQFDALVVAGYRGFINLRLRSENGTGWEAKLAGTLGVRYARLPIANALQVDEPNARELGRLLADFDGPTVIYCANSMRVGAIYGAKLYYVDGVSPEEALRRGQAAGAELMAERIADLVGLGE